LAAENSSSTARFLARIAWIVPVLLFALGLYEARVVVDLAKTAREGVSAVAEVTRYERVDRQDVTQAEVDLLIRMPDRETLVRERLSLPYSIAHRVEKDTLHVRVLRGSGQEIVIMSIVGTQRRIAASNAAMSLIAMVIALALVMAWNRHLRRTKAEG
jgi:hypothetical protein